MKLTIDLTDREYQTILDSLIDYGIKYPNRERLSKKAWVQVRDAEIRQKRATTPAKD